MTRRRGGAKRGGRGATRVPKTRKNAAQLEACNEPSEIEQLAQVESIQTAEEDECEPDDHGDGIGQDGGEDASGSGDEFDQEIPATISDEHGGDLIQRLAKFPAVQSVMVPLCRLQINTRVRPLRTELEDLKVAFRNEGYIKEKGMFILSVSLSNGTIVEVDDDRKKLWGSNWLDVNNEFENELEAKPELFDLSGKMFFVWEGNHRTAAWMELISEEFWNDRTQHVRVMATFIEPDPKCEIQLVATLQRLNLLNEDAIIKTNLKDYLYNAKTICECGDETFMENFTTDEQKKLEAYRKLEVKYGKKPWYPLTRVMLGRMVYAPLYKKDCKARLGDLPTSLSTEETREKEKRIVREISKKYGRKMAKVLSIINPSLGKQWFDVLWKMPFESKRSIVTIEKLNQIAISALHEDNKVKMLMLLGGDANIRETWGLPKGDKPFICWIAKEVWMTQLHESGCALLDGILSNPIGEPVVFSSDISLLEYFEEIKVVHRSHLFESISKQMAVAQMDRSLQVDLDKASRRLVFRYLKYLQGAGSIKALPPITKAWSTLESKASMFSDYMLKEHGKLSEWERKNCPWWLDMSAGHCLDEEIELMQKHQKGKLLVSSSSSEEESHATSLQHELVENVPKCSPKVQVGRPKRRRLLDSVASHHDTFDVEQPLAMSSKNRNSSRLSFELVYLPLESFSLHSKIFTSTKCEQNVICCDYVSLGVMVKKGKTDVHEFQFIRDFFKRNFFGPCRRSGQDCSWSVNSIFIDLPTGHEVYGIQGTIPSWNVLTDEHVLFSLGLSAAFMDDHGWVILFSSVGSLGLVERHSKAVGLHIARRFIVLDDAPFGELDIMESKVKMETLVLFLFHKVNSNPSFSKSSAEKVGSMLKLSVEREVLMHHLPSQERTINHVTREPWRGNLEKSPSFMLFLMEYLCPPGGNILDMGCGTGATLKAAKHSHRSCLSLDFDEALVKECLLPMLDAGKKKNVTVGSSFDGIHEEEVHTFQVPLD